jgi:threonylcarbamoyladenosine tRNA methylthiotransferase MtaB
LAQPEIITFGCRLNAFESEVMRGHARAAGLAGAVIVNTCAVTAEAERQARQAIRRARRERPEAQIIVTGCAAQIDPDSYAAMAEVDRVLGNEEKLKAESFAPQAAARIAVDDIMTVEETTGHLIEGFEGRTRAFVQVQQGCDHRCTFCVIPFGRGNSRSVPVGEVVRQVERLVDNGVAEIVLSGVDITGYGRDLPGRPGLGQLARRLLALVPGLRRLRLSSVDPVELDDELLRLLAGEERLMPHLHLSLQSGDDMILKRMKRRHLGADVLRLCTRARALRPDVVFGADLIAGFPTETEAMFESFPIRRGRAPRRRACRRCRGPRARPGRRACGRRGRPRWRSSWKAGSARRHACSSKSPASAAASTTPRWRSRTARPARSSGPGSPALPAAG